MKLWNLFAIYMKIILTDVSKKLIHTNWQANLSVFSDTNISTVNCGDQLLPMLSVSN